MFSNSWLSTQLHAQHQVPIAQGSAQALAPGRVQDLPLAGFDREASAFVMEQYKLRGIHYHGQASPTAISKAADGKLTVHVEPYKRKGEPFDITDVDQARGTCPCRTPFYLQGP